MPDYEIRTAEMWPDADYEMRAAPDGLTLEGYAAVFGKPSLPLAFANVAGGKRFREIIHPGAFTKTLAELPDVTLRYQHNLTTLPLGRTRAGTLALSEDDHGLAVQASLPDNEWGRPIRDAVARGDVSGMSFRFAKVIDKWTQDPDGTHVRHLHEVRLGPEVSITDYPAYPDTSAAVRHLAAEVDADPDDLADAFRALRDPDAKLSAEQHALLMSLINARVDVPYVGPRLAQARERLAAIAH
jgi:HK97 family phage prohead protease